MTAPATTEPSALAPAESSRWRRLRDPLLVAAMGLAATAYVGVVDPNQPGHYPLCPTKYLSGFDCPGCGGLRSVHSLVTGDVAGALDHNAFAVLVLLPLGVLLWARWFVRAWRGDPPSRERSWWQRPAALWTLVAVMVVFTVVRNIPGVALFAWLGSSAQ
jgi:hypothetical protein